MAYDPGKERREALERVERVLGELKSPGGSR